MSRPRQQTIELIDAERSVLEEYHPMSEEGRDE